MMMKFDADLSDWLRAFGNIEKRVADASPAHERIGDMLVTEAKANIDSDGGATQWKPLSDYTLRQRKAQGTGNGTAGGTKMLRATNALYKSLTKDVQGGHVDIGSSLSDVPYARAQFYGHKGRPPKHSPFAWRAGVMTRVAAIYIHYFFGQLR